MKLLIRIQVLEAQHTLSLETIKSTQLLKSNILSSVQPKIGRVFTVEDLEIKKLKVLQNTRKKLLALAVEEKDIFLEQLNEEFNTSKEEYINSINDPSEFLSRLEQSSSKQFRKLNEKFIKKTAFHLQRRQEMIEFIKFKLYRKKKKKKPNAGQKKKKRSIYKVKQKQLKQRKIQTLVGNIKEESIVVNLSNQDIPNAVHILLQKGLGFVSSQKVDIQDLKLDTKEFIRKFEWRSYFPANPELETELTRTHEDLKSIELHSPTVQPPTT